MARTGVVVGAAMWMASCAHLPAPGTLQVLCAQGQVARCTELADFEWGRGDAATELWALGRACELGDDRSCVWQAARLAWGRGAPKDLEKALALLNAACRRDQVACNWQRELTRARPAFECTPVPGDGLNKEEIKAAIDTQVDEARSCYEAALREESAVELDVTLAWRIGAGGGVETVSIVKDTAPSSRVADCMRERVGAWRFPCPHGGGTVNVTFPFQLRTKKDE